MLPPYGVRSIEIISQFRRLLLNKYRYYLAYPPTLPPWHINSTVDNWNIAY